MTLAVLYEDSQLIVVEKPAGMESQSAKDFEPDMVSEIKKHIHKLSPALSTAREEPYVGVIHRLDKPVSGILVYAKTKAAAASLSRQVQEQKMTKRYTAVVCGKPVDNQGTYVDYLWKDGKSNCSRIVDKGEKGAKRAELFYRVEKVREENGEICCLLEIELKTGRHHQIRVQMAGHGTPLWGDKKYNPAFAAAAGKAAVALCASGLLFTHPVSGKRMEFSVRPRGGGFELFSHTDEK